MWRVGGTMGKYTPLGAFLRRWRQRNGSQEAVELNFDEIERIIGALLPRAAATPEWWTNDPDGSKHCVQCASWLDSGYLAHLKAGCERVRFRPQAKDGRQEEDPTTT